MTTATTRRFCLLAIAVALATGTAVGQNPVRRAGLIFDAAPFKSSHASTLVETDRGVTVAWYGGEYEGSDDVRIWLSSFNGSRWSRPKVVADGIQTDGSRLPSWNPVLFQPYRGPLLLFYRVGPNPREWWTLVKISADAGETWSEPVGLPEGFLGPIRTKPVQLGNKDIVMGSSTEYDGWVAHIERFSFPEQGRTTPVDSWASMLASADAWQKTEPIHRLRDFAAIQPAILLHDNDHLQVLCRTKQGVISESWSSTGGEAWSPMVSTGLPNPNSGIDALRLADGRFLLVSNPSTERRTPLTVSLSDDGVEWHEAFVLESGDGEYSYPAVIQGRDGSVHITYTWKREAIKHVQLDVSLLSAFPADAAELQAGADGQSGGR